MSCTTRSGESETAFFAKVVDAQIDFATDGSSATLHQMGRDVTWPRIDDATAEQIRAALETRVQNQTAAPGTETALRSLIAGIAGAVGAFFLLMALSSGRSAAESKYVLPLLVPAIVFAGAPIVNTLVSTTKEGNWGYVNWKFIAGIVLAAAGTAMVMKFKPSPPAAPTPAAAHASPGAAKSESGPVVRGPARAVAPGYADVTTRTYHVS